MVWVFFNSLINRYVIRKPDNVKKKSTESPPLFKKGNLHSSQIPSLNNEIFACEITTKKAAINLSVFKPGRYMDALFFN